VEVIRVEVGGAVVAGCADKRLAAQTVVPEGSLIMPLPEFLSQQPDCHDAWLVSLGTKETAWHEFEFSQAAMQSPKSLMDGI